MKPYIFAHVKTTKQFYRFQEVDEDGVVLDRNDPSARFNFGCLYLRKDQFKEEPTHIVLSMDTEHEKS